MPEIWVRYGQVEVSFDLKQENLASILEPSNLPKIKREDMEARVESISADTLLLLSSTPAIEELLGLIFEKNQGIRTILYTKGQQALARRVAGDHSLKAEAFDYSNLVDAGQVEGNSVQFYRQLKEAPNLVAVTSVHYDPLFGLSGSASDLISLDKALKALAFSESLDEIPVSAPRESAASQFGTKVLQTCPNVDAIEVVEKPGSGILDFYYGDPESVHAQATEFWKKAFKMDVQSRAERIIFGAGGAPNDRTLSDALAKSFFNVVSNVAPPADSDASSKICLLAECQHGLGSESMMRYITGAITPAAPPDVRNYHDGLEILIGLFRSSRNLEVSMLSTLPTYFLGKFDFKSVKGARKVPSALIGQGSRAKILVVPDASHCYFGEP
jgi:hypothetical protein